MVLALPPVHIAENAKWDPGLGALWKPSPRTVCIPFSTLLLGHQWRKVPWFHHLCSFTFSLNWSKVPRKYYTASQDRTRHLAARVHQLWFSRLTPTRPYEDTWGAKEHLLATDTTQGPGCHGRPRFSQPQDGGSCLGTRTWGLFFSLRVMHSLLWLAMPEGRLHCPSKHEQLPLPSHLFAQASSSGTT